MLGLNFLVDNQVDQAIDELTQATSTDTDALEIQMILGNLYRQKGQVGRAINVHQALLQRTDLRTLEHAYVLLCLGLDYRHGGFVDRALEAFQEVVRLDRRNRYAFVNLQKLYEDQHQWAEAARVREQIAAIDARRHEEDQQILGFLRNEMGGLQASSGDVSGAAKTFQDVIDIDSRIAPAYLNLGDVRERQGNLAAAVEAWESLVQAVPDRAYLASNASSARTAHSRRSNARYAQSDALHDNCAIDWRRPSRSRTSPNGRSATCRAVSMTSWNIFHGAGQNESHPLSLRRNPNLLNLGGTPRVNSRDLLPDTTAPLAH